LKYYAGKLGEIIDIYTMSIIYINANK